MSTRTHRTVERLARHRDACVIPQPVGGDPGRLLVDATWGTITPMQPAPGVHTIGELEVIDHIASGLPLVDTRLSKYFAEGTLPGARSIPHTEIGRRLDEVDATIDTIVFCNGPQCLATPDAVRILLEAGQPAEHLLYYRGGVHDWLTLGFPLEAGT